MIAKCKAIAHGKTALEYIFRETKLKNKLLIQNLCGDTAERIYNEMNLVTGSIAVVATSSCGWKSVSPRKMKQV